MERMLANGVGELLIRELVTAVTRNNYGQDSHVNAFTGVLTVCQINVTITHYGINHN